LIVSLLVCVGSAIYASFVSCREKKEEEKRALVRFSSKYYNDVVQLNNSTFFHRLRGIQRSFTITAHSKAQYENIDIASEIIEYLEEHYDQISAMLPAIDENIKIRSGYYYDLGRLHSSASPEECRTLGIRFEEYMDIEDELVDEIMLNIPTHFELVCYVQYTSPQGRNHYSRSQVYTTQQIKAALIQIDNKRQYRQTEEFRRKTERAKVTPSLRYSVLQRDGFRCVICGRSAQDNISLEVDHIVPISKGGQTEYANLQTLCMDCNRGKSNKM
jgi:5-methylcytosine-specific restriction endonuclease McrA